MQGLMCVLKHIFKQYFDFSKQQTYVDIIQKFKRHIQGADEIERGWDWGEGRRLVSSCTTLCLCFKNFEYNFKRPSESNPKSKKSESQIAAFLK